MLERERKCVYVSVCERDREREGPVKCKTVIFVVPGSGSLLYVCKSVY